MRKFIEGNPANDFFEQNPQLRYFKEILDLIKVHGEKRASKLMWTLYLYEDPSSKFYRVPYKERQIEIASNYLKEPKFDWDQLKDLSDAYSRLVLSKEQMLYKFWADKIDEGLVYYKHLKFDEKAKEILDGMDKIGKMWKTYEEAQKKMIESDQKTQVRGGATLSSREKRRRS